MLLGVAASRTLRGAATAAQVKPSVAHRQLARLQQRVGVPLIAGTRDDLTLTEAGTGILTRGRRFLREINEAARRATRGGGRVSHLRTLRLGAVGDDLEEFVDQVARTLPSLMPTVVRTGPRQCRELFDQYRVDAVYSSYKPPESNRLSRPSNTYRVIDEPMWVGLPAHHAIASEPVVSLADLRADEWIAGPCDTGRDVLRDAYTSAGLEPPPVNQVAESSSMVRSLLWRGAGVALLPPTSVLPAGNANFVVRPLRDGPSRIYLLTTDPAVVADNLARALREHLQASYRERAMRLNPAYAATLDGPRPEFHTPATVADLATLSPAEAPAENEGRLIEPEDMIMLRVIGESGSLNRAAPTLLVSQPALTRRLKLLERKLGRSLLVRGYRGTALTTTAKELVAAATDAEREFHSRLPLQRRAPSTLP